MTTKIVELIRTQEYRGQGTPEDPCRNVLQLFSREGILIASYDPYEGVCWVNAAAALWME